MSIKITCINKDNGDHYDPHLAITHLGWVNEENGKTGRSTSAEVIKFIEVNSGTAYTKDVYGKMAYLVVRESRHGNKYLKTVADGRDSNNLLELPECLL
ncbi:MAG: DUF3892 domain-containing protein [Bacilli bacterium]|nr:DUF3892 domain-containing protein [Bacilli bacterium]